jgi:tRNA(Ile)-lysidine synthase
MPSAHHAQGVAWARPFLAIDRAVIDDYVARHALVHVDDDSNDSRAHRRNALRHDVLPALRALAPGYRATLARAAAHQGEAATLLHDLARLDAAPHYDGRTLHRDALRAGTPARARNVLRWFLHEHRLPAPSTARLAAMLHQLSTARADANVRLRHAGRELGLYHGRIVVHAAAPAPYAHAWPAGAAPLDLPHGRLRFVPASVGGVDVRRLFAACVTVRSRTGGERLVTHADRPPRTLKDVLRDAAVPPWERAALPLVFAGDGLAAVPGVACDPRYAAAPGTPGATLLWGPHEPARHDGTGAPFDPA